MIKLTFLASLGAIALGSLCSAQGVCGSPATAVFRNGTTVSNLPNFSANKPVMGGTWSVSVVNDPGSAYVLTGVAAYPLPLDVVIGGGAVLVNILGSELLMRSAAR